MSITEEPTLDLPIVSVITVVYNASKLIEETMESVLAQSYRNVEYIVIDGGSNDGTCETIEKYRDRLSYYTSERDQGIYDAMNKGIKVSHGKWISFMNAGDVFYSSQVIERVIAHGPYNENTKVVYGDVALSFRNHRTIIKHLDSINEGNVQFSLNHQSTIIDGDWMRKVLYNTKYRICADADFFNETVKAGYSFQYIPETISKYDSSDGVSAKNRKLMFREFMHIQGVRVMNMKWWRGYIKMAIITLLQCLPFDWGDKLISAYVKWRVI